MAAQREQVTLHVPPAQRPGNILAVIDALTYTTESFRTQKALVEYTRSQYDFEDSKGESISLARQLGLITETSVGASLTPLARALQGMRPAARVDVLHHLFYAGGQHKSSLQGRTWVYRRFCDRLWERGHHELAGAQVNQLAGDLVNEAGEAFPEAERLALSSMSIRGLRAWLEALEPSVVLENRFRRREVCSRELLLLAIGWAAREDGAQLGTELLLNHERRQAIARVCLLEPAVLDRRLDQLLPTFPKLIVPGTRAGTYGRFVRLLQEPTVESIVAA